MSSNSTASAIPYWESPDYKGDKVRDLNASLIAITTVIVGLRLYTRGFVSKTFGVDDVLASIAFALIVTQSALDIRSVNYGSGAHIEYVPPHLVPLFFSALVNNTLIYFIGTGLMRLSIVAFLPRLAKDLSSPLFLKLVYTTGFVIVCQTLVCFFYRLTECHPIIDIWKVPTTPGLKCVSAQQEQNNLIAHQAIGIIVDFALFALPIWVINSKMMKSAKKVQVILVFSVGLFVVITGVVRMVMLNTLLFLADPTFAMSTIGPWTDLEGHAGLWVASFPALQPLIRTMSYKLGLRSALQSYGQSSGGKNNKSGAKVPGGSNNWASTVPRKSGYAKNGSGIDLDDGSERGIVAGDKSDTELDNLSADSTHIHKKVDYDVRVEEIPRGDYDDPRRVTNKSWVDV
ncbi:uncharacterized protein LY89DRAFT_746789 [Mollisia scopiformis]|uniref:Rhodopsin domain-containing protein n=1 Tax=Mollisia scopiformis TaxID=149040 RepID=A0A194XAT1_MOLSC|nr:uncharacterized protein LY89DRAFT_746789 [Mollisia scopiformis]KUJ17275.1 hypothetical protein LY89DRAFT_746789 [Mollisia scopiformis]